MDRGTERRASGQSCPGSPAAVSNCCLPSARCPPAWHLSPGASCIPGLEAMSPSYPCVTLDGFAEVPHLILGR
ncbi:rCG59673 [Rattus norvegicus]|uniref:RCG59673 n=1 Tax=Rattus norvegicus TaxID=10116 RepID=A6HSQ4_RAT|nr:rCG59673 [Rattus norvegicus]